MSSGPVSANRHRIQSAYITLYEKSGHSRNRALLVYNPELNPKKHHIDVMIRSQFCSSTLNMIFRPSSNSDTFCLTHLEWRTYESDSAIARGSDAEPNQKHRPAQVIRLAPMQMFAFALKVKQWTDLGHIGDVPEYTDDKDVMKYSDRDYADMVLLIAEHQIFLQCILDGKIETKREWTLDYIARHIKRSLRVSSIDPSLLEVKHDKFVLDLAQNKHEDAVLSLTSQFAELAFFPQTPSEADTIAMDLLCKKLEAVAVQQQSVSTVNEASINDLASNLGRLHIHASEKVVSVGTESTDSTPVMTPATTASSGQTGMHTPASTSSSRGASAIYTPQSPPTPRTPANELQIGHHRPRVFKAGAYWSRSFRRGVSQ